MYVYIYIYVCVCVCVCIYIYINVYVYIIYIHVGDPQIPGIVKKNYLKYLYKFEILVPFEILPLGLAAAIPAPLPTEMLSRAALAAHDSISFEDFRQCFHHWERCWGCCIQSQGESFEGD